MITVLHRGGYAQMITILHRGGGFLGTPKSDYVICARPLIPNSTLRNNRQLSAGLQALTTSCMKTKTASPSPHSGILQSHCWVQIASLILKVDTLSTGMMKMSILPSQKKRINSIKLFGSSPLKKSARIYF